MFLTGEEYNALQLLLNNMHYTLGNRLSVVQTFRTEVYTYDANGNRKTKTTPCGTIEYSYDRENRLISSGWNGQVAVTYTYDENGNLLMEDGRLTVSTYKYNGQNRMVYSRVIDKLQKSAVTTRYEYDAFGRRVIVQEEGSDTMKTLYDGFTFEIVKESPIFANGLFTDKYNTGIQYSTSNTGKPTGDRYRYIEDESDDSRYRYIEDSVYELQTPRFTGNRTVLYGNGSPVAVNRGSSKNSSTSGTSSSSGTSNGGFYSPTETRYTNTSYLQDNISYLGTDILGSVRTVTSSYGTVESESTYDVFGTPITGTYTAGVDFGYLGKPYDTATGLYNYGYRDYNPTAARFTTVDPIKDGSNWFVYVNNDPVNWVDLWGLCASSADEKKINYIKEFFDIFSLDIKVGLGFNVSFISEIGVDLYSQVGNISSSGLNLYTTSGVSVGVLGIEKRCEGDQSSTLFDEGNISVTLGPVEVVFDSNKEKIESNTTFQFGFQAVLGVNLTVSGNEFLDFLDKISGN